ncbi:MAG TPA: tyrosine-type recombinase/integrase, partial [Nitrospirota bacterium]|nr:tyrosine-type recombinase/integrase [Nitrospirota bacterium]
FTYNGKQVRKPTETTDRKLAEKIYHKVMTQIAEGKWFEKPVGSNKSVRELFEKYLDEHSAKNRTVETYERDKGVVKIINRYFGDMQLSAVGPKTISEYKVMRRDKGRAPSTVNRELCLLSHAFNLAIKEWEWIDYNPVSRVSRDRVNNQVERWLTCEEQEKLLAVSPSWLREIIIFAVNTGWRRSEILALKWEKVDLSRKTLTILEQKNKGKDTQPFNEQVLEVLKARHKIRSIKSNLVFYDSNGIELDGRHVLKVFTRTVTLAKIAHCRFHDLRHTFATRLVQAGVDLYKVQKLMRHKSPIMTQRYAHHYSESLRDGVDTLDRISTILAHSKVSEVKQVLQAFE